MKPWKFQTKTKFHQKKVKFSKLFANLLGWSIENFEKSADLGPLPAEIELLPVEIYKVYKQISKKSTSGGHLPRFTSKISKKFQFLLFRTPIDLAFCHYTLNTLRNLEKNQLTSVSGRCIYQGWQAFSQETSRLLQKTQRIRAIHNGLQAFYSQFMPFPFPPGGATCQNSKNKVPWGPLVIPSKKHRCSRTLRSRVIKLSAHTKK